MGTAAGGDPQAVSFRMFLKGGLKMFRVLDEIPAHVEKEPSGFRWDNSVFSAGKDCEPVLFFRLPEDFAEIGLVTKRCFAAAEMEPQFDTSMRYSMF